MARKDYTNEVVFKFDADDVKRFIQYELDLLHRIGESFDFVYDKMVAFNHHLNIGKKKIINLNKVKWNEGKNYHWCAITSGNIQLLIRQYQNHFTIYSNLTESKTLSNGRIYTKNRYSSFTFHTDTNKLPEEKQDEYNCNSFIELNNYLLQIIEIVRENHVQSMWNPYTIKVPDHCEIKNIFDGENISSIDRLIFCAEEISNQHMGLYSENEMIERIKGLSNRIGMEFNYQYNLKAIKTEFPKQYSEPYYHAIGILLVDKKDGKEKFTDVYSLTQWYLEELSKFESLKV